jgi:hypothetical protein
MSRSSRDISARRRRKQSKGLPWAYISVGIVIAVLLISLVVYNVVDKSTTSIGDYKFPFQCLGIQGETLHVHIWLRIVIDGQNVTVPAYIGIVSPNGSSTCFEPMHTHDASGIIHIESTVLGQNYTLGDLFDIWSATYGSVNFNGTSHPIVFNSTDIFGYKADATHNITLLVDGKSAALPPVNVPPSQWPNFVLNPYPYCDLANSQSPSSPCYATAQGNPYYDGQNASSFEADGRAGHTVVIEYSTNSTSG